MAEHEDAMERLIQVAQHALETGDVPVAAAVMDPEGFVIATATNTKERDSDPTAHAEILALRAAQIQTDAFCSPLTI